MVMDVMAPGGLSHTATGGGWASRRSNRQVAGRPVPSARHETHPSRQRLGPKFPNTRGSLLRRPILLLLFILIRGAIRGGFQKPGTELCILRTAARTLLHSVAAEAMQTSHPDTTRRAALI